MQAKYVVGIDIGGTNIRIGASQKDGRLEYFKKVSTQEIFHHEGGAAALVRFLENYFSNEVDLSVVEAVSIGIPSILDQSREIVVQTPNIAGFNNVPLKKELENAFHIKAFLEKDVNMIFWNDIYANSLPKIGLAVGIYVGTGIGNSIFIDGQPYSGKNGAAGEIGHIPIGHHDHICRCGNEGCSECYASGWRLVEIMEKNYPGEMISTAFTLHKSDKAIQEFISEIARTIAIEISLLDPEYVVLGGGVINMPDFPKEWLEEKVHRLLRKPYPESNLKIFYSKDADENGVKGAILFGWNKL